MKRSLWILTAISAALTIILAACGAPPGKAPAPTIAPTPKVPSVSPVTDVVAASAEVRPERQAEMSFAISAPVKEILVKKGDVVKAGQPLMTLSTLELELSVKEIGWAVRSAEVLRDRTYTSYKKVRLDNKTFYFAGFLEKRQEMEARLQAAQARLDAATYELAQGTLLAPFDGVVVEIHIKANEFASAGQVVITVADTAHMQIATTDLSERDVPRVRIGQGVKVHVKALDKIITGKVARISPVSEIVGGDIIYPVTIDLDEQAAGLLWGMSAEVEIETR